MVSTWLQGGSRLIVNMTASASWRHRPVGIIRVERELIKQLHRLYDGRITPVVLEPGGSRFRHVSQADFDRVFDDAWVKGRSDDPGLAVSSDSRRLEPSANDRFVSVGSDWSFQVPSIVSRLYGDRKVLVSACYDLIPLLFPEYTPDPHFETQFIHHYTTMASVGKSLFAISEHSKSDLRSFWIKEGLDVKAPPVRVIPLAGLDAATADAELSSKDAKALDFVRKDGDYVIFVSTIEPRKNHQLLLDVWRELFEERGERCPQLLFVGMRGWGSNDLLNQMSRMPGAAANKIKWMEGLSDELLSRLYAGCLFAAFPSLYEGWGLAATEAMSHGKVCLISNSSSLGEATQHLVPSMDPRDFFSWRSEIIRMIDDERYRKAAEQRVTSQWKTRSWNDVGDEFKSLLEEVR